MRMTYIETLLDTFSFFFVTTDLYGEKNLSTLNDRLATSLGAARSLKPDRVFWLVFGTFLIFVGVLLYKSYTVHYDWYQKNVWLVMTLIHDWTVTALIIIGVISVIPTFIVMAILKGFIGIAVFFAGTIEIKWGSAFRGCDFVPGCASGFSP